MCTVSNVGDFYGNRWKSVPTSLPFTSTATTISLGISREEFNALKAEVEEMKVLLRAAKRIDQLTGQPDCEMDEKLVVLRRVAELVGVDLEDVLSGR